MLLFVLSKIIILRPNIIFNKQKSTRFFSLYLLVKSELIMKKKPLGSTILT